MFSARSAAIMGFVLSALSFACAAPVEGTEEVGATGTVEQKLAPSDNDPPEPPPPPPEQAPDNTPTCSGCKPPQ